MCKFDIRSRSTDRLPVLRSYINAHRFIRILVHRETERWDCRRICSYLIATIHPQTSEGSSRNGDAISGELIGQWVGIS